MSVRTRTSARKFNSHRLQRADTFTVSKGIAPAGLATNATRKPAMATRLEEGSNSIMLFPTVPPAFPLKNLSGSRSGKFLTGAAVMGFQRLTTGQSESAAEAIPASAPTHHRFVLLAFDAAAGKIEVVVLQLGRFELASAAMKMVLAMFAALAKMERDLLVERSQSGLVTAKREGVSIDAMAMLCI